jgi:hypothetical protein
MGARYVPCLNLKLVCRSTRSAGYRQRLPLLAEPPTDDTAAPPPPRCIARPAAVADTPPAPNLSPRLPNSKGRELRDRWRT